MYSNKLRPILLLVLLGAALGAAADSVYQPPADFVAEAFAGSPPRADVLWIDKSLRGDIEHILGHPPGALRVRYWRRAERTVWILEEIGKELPITTGVIVQNGLVEKLRVLIFRESRGWEVRYPFFTDQFIDARLAADGLLDQKIDGISGATFSVQALKKQATLALFLDRHLRAIRVHGS